MKAVVFPFHIDPQGHLAVATTYADLVKSQLIDVLMTNYYERIMRPQYGANARSLLFAGLDDLTLSDTSTQIAQSITAWSPRAILESVGFSTDVMKPTTVYLDVAYRVGVFDEATVLRFPTSQFLNEESDI